MSKIYFIDSENVGDNWIDLLPIIPMDDEVLVFYTTKSPHMNYKNVIILRESPKKITFIKCFEGCNALDFQLCTELGARVSLHAADEFVVVSNDTGYDAIVKYWRERSIRIKRIQGKYCANENQAKPAANERTPQLEAEKHLLLTSKPAGNTSDAADKSSPEKGQTIRKLSEKLFGNDNLSASEFDDEDDFIGDEPILTSDSTENSDAAVTDVTASSDAAVTGTTASSDAVSENTDIASISEKSDTNSEDAEIEATLSSIPENDTVIANDQLPNFSNSKNTVASTEIIRDLIRSELEEESTETIDEKHDSESTTTTTDATEAGNSTPDKKAKKAKKADAKKKDSVPEDAKELFYLIGKENLLELHEALVQLYGSTDGKKYYNSLKSDAVYADYLATHPKMSLEEKHKKYCSIIFKLSDSAVEMPADFSVFVTTTWKKKKNLNSFRSTLLSKYEKGKGDTYYSLVKAHVKILDKIK